MATKDSGNGLSGKKNFVTDAMKKFEETWMKKSAEEKEAWTSDIDEIRNGFRRGMECLQSLN